MATTKKTAETKATETKSTETKPKRTTRKKVTTTIFVEFGGKQLSQEDLVNEAKSVLVSLGKETDGVKKFDFYIQPENKAIFFTADGEGSENYKIVIE